MRWGAQVVHVMWKDLRELRVLVLLYAVSLAIAAQHSLDTADSWNPLLEVAMLLVFPLGMLVVAAFVQADSPTRNDALWITRPLSASAVFAAKILASALVILGLAVLAQAVVLGGLDVPVSNTVVLLWNSARIYGIWLLIALMVAAATPDLRTFIVVLIGGAFAIVFAGSLVFPKVPQQMLAGGHVALIAAGIAGSFAFVLALYLRRDVSRFTGLIGIVPIACLLMSMASSTPPSRQDTQRKISASVTVRLEAEALDVHGALPLVFHLEGGEAGNRYLVNSAKIVVHARGESFDLFVAPGSIELFPGAGTTIPFLSGRPIPAAFDSVVFRGQLAGDTHETVQRIPLKQGATVSRDGKRIVIEALDSNSADDFITLQTNRIENGTDTLADSEQGHDLASDYRLVNDVLRDTIPLYHKRASGQTRMFILLGASLREMHETYRPGPITRMGQPRFVERAWLQGAHLELSPWIPLIGFPVHDTYVVR